ncbi:hypothetical protein APA_1875 [Pseudanabaena sp. lw0831]|uniref:hypothetical protein n=1 Tax=Pseudanabaena sp. lw0831 TaxID=1357935 RepID=UPI001916908E|nr:hypothetical protein [Pseudanabaena sp. lw0831]GBO53927.1 hypothetical protein APA_1875 [Pseudanabaena sp. lw0831]
MSAIANSNQPEDKPKTSRVSSYWRNIPWKKLSSLVMAIALCFYLTACGGNNKPVSKATDKKVVTSINLTEVSPPTEIQRLSRLLDGYAPQVSIVSPKSDEVLNDTQVSVKFDVKNLPIFKNADFGLGPHIHVTLDNQEYKAIYDLNQTATFDHLSAGTHTIRAFASRPWHESFKNQGAYAQTTFNVLTKTGENTPEAKTPLLTYSRPVGTYGAEPIMLDFYLQNAPLHLLGKDDEEIDDWQVRATIDGQSFTFDRWEPIYLKGFKTGQNWVKLELLEPDGDAIANVFNSTAHVINYQPNGTDTLARLVRGEKIANIEAIVNPDYVPPAPEVIPSPVESVAPVVAPTEKPTESSKTEVVSPTSTPVATPKEETKPVDKASSVIPVVPVPVVPVIPVPVAPAAPIITKSSPVAEPAKVEPVPTKVDLTEPIKVEPIKVKAAPVEPIKAAPVPTKVAPAPEPTKVEPIKVKAAPVAAETIKTAPIIKAKNAPVTESEKVTPESPKSKPVPVVEPVKIAPAPSRSKYAPIAIPGRPIAPKVAPQVTTPKEAPQEVPKATKEAAQVMPKAEPAKGILPEKEPKTFKPTAAPTDVFKNFNFDPRKFFPAKPEAASTETK